jgi:hypothetical protein
MECRVVSCGEGEDNDVYRSYTLSPDNNDEVSPPSDNIIRG